MVRQKFAFIIHPRVDVQQDFGNAFGPARHIPDRAYQWVLRKAPFPAFQWAECYLRDQPVEPAGWLIMVPLSGRHMLELPRHEVVFRVEQAVEKGIALGATVIGLGALTSPVTGGGAQLAWRRNIALTNGNAYTAAMMFQAVERLVRASPRGADTEVAVVGASGSVGSCVVQLMARSRTAARVTLVARNAGPLTKVAAEARAVAPDVDFQVHTRMDVVRRADVVVLLTASADNLLRSEHLKEGARVLDGTQPRNSVPELCYERPDITVVDGGWVSIPGMEITNSTGTDWPHGCAFACLTETVLLALAGQREHFCIGNATVSQVDHTVALARRFRSLGFGMAPFHSFGVPLPPEWFDPPEERPLTALPGPAELVVGEPRATALEAR
jgi:predicted amino acid dehydrogenase